MSPVYVNYVTTVSSSSQCTPIHSGNHPPYTPDSEQTFPLPSSLQISPDRYIAVHRHESQQSLLDEIFHVQFGLKRLHCVKTLSLQFTGWAAKVSILITVKLLVFSVVENNQSVRSAYQYAIKGLSMLISPAYQYADLVGMQCIPVCQRRTVLVIPCSVPVHCSW